LEKPEHIDDFLRHPEEIADKLNRALQNGLDSDFAERHLKELVDEADKVNRKNEMEWQAEIEIRNKQVKTALAARLDIVDCSNTEEMKRTIKYFCVEKNMQILPEPDMPAQVVSEEALDWLSDKVGVGFKIVPGFVIVYKKNKGAWFRTPVDSI
jgi:hypothetical protein